MRVLREAGPMGSWKNESPQTGWKLLLEAICFLALAFGVFSLVARADTGGSAGVGGMTTSGSSISGSAAGATTATRGGAIPGSTATTSSTTRQGATVPGSTTTTFGTAAPGIGTATGAPGSVTGTIGTGAPAGSLNGAPGTLPARSITGARSSEIGTTFATPTPTSTARF